MGKIFKALEKMKASNHETGEALATDDDADIKPHSDNAINKDNSIKTYESLEDMYLEENPPLVDSSLICSVKPYSFEAEQFRMLKNRILFPEKGEPPRCIMVTSTTPEEGKSFVASNLAVSMAQNIDDYVLLMDCDLRSPSLHTIFGSDNTNGLSDYLSQGKQLSSLFAKTYLQKLTILPAGPIPPNPSELLSSEMMRRLITEVKVRYHDRYVIIDTPPLYATSETNAIARQVDGIIIVIRQGKTQKKDVIDIIDHYGKEKILGVVYNHVSQKIKFGKTRYYYMNDGGQK